MRRSGRTVEKLDAATIATNVTGEATIIDDNDSSEKGKKRSSTPHSITNTRRNMLGRKAAKDMKGKKARDDDIAIAMDRIANARLQANEDRKVARNLEQEVEAWRAALEERLATNMEMKLALEEKKLASEEHQRLVEEERKIFFMDSFNMDERQNECIYLARDEVLAKKRMSLATNMNAPMAGYVGYVGIGAPVGVFGVGYGSVGGPASMFGGGMGGMAGMSTMGGIAGMGLGSMAGMGLGGFGGVFRGISAPMAGMGAPTEVSMEPLEHHRGDSWPLWILLYLLQLMMPMKKKQKMEMTLKM
jgi:hypothetical protein